MQTFKLIPFPVPEIPAIEMTGTVTRQGNLLSLHYSMHGDIEKVLLPAPSNFPTRKHDLWKSTCFEFFLAVKDQSEYWEFNMSPSGDWNVYAIDAYRQVNMREESAFPQLLFQFRKTDTQITLAISIDLNPILRHNQPLQLGITSIIQTQDENETYWALVHPGQEADFHLRESFIIDL